MIIATGKYSNGLQQTRTLTLWTVAAAFSLALNILLFDFMPCLIDRNPGRPEYSQFVESVNIIRIERPEPPVRKKEKKRKIMPKEQVKKLIREKQVYAKRPVKQVLDLPFEINPKLTAISGTLKVPPVKMVRLDSLGLKGLYEVGEIDHPLTPIVQVPPIYPMRAKHMGIEGWVRVKFIVNEEGRVDDIKILDSRPEEIFNSAVLRCVSAWRFTPGTVYGVPVKTLVETTVRFELE